MPYATAGYSDVNSDRELLENAWDDVCRRAGLNGDDARLIVDIDLTPLGKPQEEFDENGRAIRREFANVDEEKYRAGRAELLKRFLQRPQLYFTEVFRRRYEEPARQNLERSIRGFE